jgi:hypothetical protein
MEQLEGIQGQIQRIKNYIKERRGQAQDWLPSDKHEATEQLKDALEAAKVRLSHLRELVQAALKRVQGKERDSHEEDRLQRVDAHIAEAQQFVVETLTAFRAHGAHTFNLVKERYFDRHLDDPSVATTCRAHDGNVAVDTETLGEVAAAAVDAADAAITAVQNVASEEESHRPAPIDEGDLDSEWISSTVPDIVVSSGNDEMLMETEAVAMMEIEAEEDPYETPLNASREEVLDPDEQEPDAGATSMDHAQILISQSFALLRSQASRFALSNPRST